QALAWLSRSLGGLPTPFDVLRAPSASLSAAYTHARARAEGAESSVTTLGINLVDVEMLQRGGNEFESFAHACVLVVAPQGVRVLQAWGEHGYSLRENIGSDAGRIRSLDEGAVFAKDFDRLCTMKGAWNKEINRLYARLFDVDVLALMRAGRMRRPMVPKFRAWVRVLEVGDVQRTDV
ncbi:hypothetical protein K488DRAFT_32136, partial [Vararia minispora EC-137]